MHDNLRAVRLSMPRPSVKWSAINEAIQKHAGHRLTRETIETIVDDVCLRTQDWFYGRDIPDWYRVRSLLTQTGIIRDAGDGTFDVLPPWNRTLTAHTDPADSGDGERP